MIKHSILLKLQIWISTWTCFNDLCFDKKSHASGVKNENMPDQQLAKELQKPIVKQFKKREVQSSLIDNICGVSRFIYLADMQLISKFNIGIRFLLCVIDIFSKYAWVIYLKDKKGIKLLILFTKALKESNRKANKILVHKGSEFYVRSMKWWLEKDATEMCSAHN